MALPNSGIIIPRQSVVGHEAEYVKMFDPPTASPPTCELLTPTNPVPEFMQSLGLASVGIPHTVRPRLLNNTTITAWDGAIISNFTISDRNLNSPFNKGFYPAPTLRVPRGSIFHAETQGAGPPPHTIHWHGVEPTPMNDGVGHCSQEVGQYTYQWQPNFIGSYFYHCHRNTMQHFEFGLFGFLIIETPDAFDNPGPFGNPGGYPRRTAANLQDFKTTFPGWIGGSLATGGPHAMTVPYDAEALWVFDDIDNTWRTDMPNAKSTFPTHGTQPGVNDQFFFGDFHDFNPNYFFVTGVNFPAAVGGTAAIPPGVTIPAALNSGVTGMQVSVNAPVNKTIFIRCLCAAYGIVKVTFPLDVVIIEYDGRAMGVPPLAQYNHAYTVKAGTPIELSTARRFGCLMRSATPVNAVATAQFIHQRSNQPVFTGQIPIQIT